MLTLVTKIQPCISGITYGQSYFISSLNLIQGFGQDRDLEIASSKKMQLMIIHEPSCLSNIKDEIVKVTTLEEQLLAINVKLDRPDFVHFANFALKIKVGIYNKSV